MFDRQGMINGTTPALWFASRESLDVPRKPSPYGFHFFGNPLGSFPTPGLGQWHQPAAEKPGVLLLHFFPQLPFASPCGLATFIHSTKGWQPLPTKKRTEKPRGNRKQQETPVAGEVDLLEASPSLVVRKPDVKPNEGTLIDWTNKDGLPEC